MYHPLPGPLANSVLTVFVTKSKQRTMCLSNSATQIHCVNIWNYFSLLGKKFTFLKHNKARATERQVFTHLSY